MTTRAASAASDARKASFRSTGGTVFRNRGETRATVTSIRTRGTSRPTTFGGHRGLANGCGTKWRSRLGSAGNVSRTEATNTRKGRRSCGRTNTTKANRSGNGRRTCQARIANQTAGGRAKDSTCRWTAAWVQDTAARSRCRDWSRSKTSSRTTNAKDGPYRGRWRSRTKGRSLRGSFNDYGSGRATKDSFLSANSAGDGVATKRRTSRATRSRRSCGRSYGTAGYRGSYGCGAPMPRNSTSRSEDSVTSSATTSASTRTRTRRRTCSGATFSSN